MSSKKSLETKLLRIAHETDLEKVVKIANSLKRYLKGLENIKVVYDTLGKEQFQYEEWYRQLQILEE